MPEVGDTGGERWTQTVWWGRALPLGGGPLRLGTGASPKLGQIAVNRAAPIIAWIIKHWGARVRMPMLVLTTIGHRSGLPRQTPLRYLRDGPREWLVVASDWGHDAHPNWYLNLRRSPDRAWIDVDGRHVEVRAAIPMGTSRDQYWQLVVSRAPQFATYQSRTARKLPVVRLIAQALSEGQSSPR